MVNVANDDLDRLLRRTVEGGHLPVVVAVVGDESGVVYEGSAGTLDTTVGRSHLGSGTHFQIKSMTKVVTCVAAWQLVERGDLDLDDRVEEFLPEFSDVQVLEGIEGDVPRLRSPLRPATVRQLMTSTVGLGYWLWEPTLLRYEQLTGLPNLADSRADLAAFRAPMLADPGMRWVYGIGYDWLGRVVEAVAGSSLGDVVGRGITGPLGMTDTAFALSPSVQAAECPLHIREVDRWAPVGHALVERAWQSGGDGLHSTPSDYMRFQRMLLRGGELDGVRILRPETVAELFTPQLGDRPFPDELVDAVPEVTDRMALGTGWSWGNGMLLATVDRPGGRRAGSGGWSGLFNTHFWVDPASGLCAAIYTATLPFMDAETSAAVFAEFEGIIYTAI